MQVSCIYNCIAVLDSHLPIGVDYAGDASPPDFVMNHFVPTTLKKKRRTFVIIFDYYTGLLNAVERSVHLHGLFTTSR
jgi:hypothetical protein